jgi:hypothetical protein
MTAVLTNELLISQQARDLGNQLIKEMVTPPFLIELMGRKSKSLLLFKNRWTTIY